MDVHGLDNAKRGVVQIVSSDFVLVVLGHLRRT
jgi:hypothetical protein